MIRGVQPCGLHGPHLKKNKYLGPHIKYILILLILYLLIKEDSNAGPDVACEPRVEQPWFSRHILIK